MLTRKLNRLAIITGLGLLGLSMYWSQDGFNFNVAGESGYTTAALIAGWLLSFSVTVVQFVFSTNFNRLNFSILVFGIVGYLYSIYTNAQGVLHFQGLEPNATAAYIIGFFIDAVPEPLIAWALDESLEGDFLGNLLKMIGKMIGFDSPKPHQQQPKTHYDPRNEQPVNNPRPSFTPPTIGGKHIISQLNEGRFGKHAKRR